MGLQTLLVLDALDDPSQQAATAGLFIKTRKLGKDSEMIDHALRTESLCDQGLGAHVRRAHARIHSGKMGRVLCLARPLHNADVVTLLAQPSGICLEFHTQSKFGGAQKVNYAVEYRPRGRS